MCGHKLGNLCIQLQVVAAGLAAALCMAPACMRYTLEMSTTRSRLNVCSSDCPRRPAQTCAGRSAKGILNDLSDLSVAFACVCVCQRACIVSNSISAASSCACACACALCLFCCLRDALRIDVRAMITIFVARVRGSPSGVFIDPRTIHLFDAVY